jgi:hypothetical protein
MTTATMRAVAMTPAMVTAGDRMRAAVSTSKT